ncbi:MAG: LysM peptidoglycan-binding domain-containing protein [Verrucomicrobia bacterium]|nr:LysM peptidoglycan-binding domain-containing protein [Verrucomicrobiota bacterium]
MSSSLRWTLLLICSLGLCGCWPPAQGPLDEQKESNFLTGKARAQDRDFDGAIEAFDRALEVNPHSASAHFELAVIYDQQKNDYAAALYHYEKARRLRPNAYPADIARDRLEVCKRELAKTVTQTPTAEYMQKELDRLTMENQVLRQRLQEWQNYYGGRSSVMPSGSVTSAPSGSAPAPQPALAARTDAASSSAVTPTTTRAVEPRPAPTRVAVPRTHRVGPGENPSKIAARYGIKLSALRAANPGLDDRRLRVGQTLVIPAR